MGGCSHWFLIIGLLCLLTCIADNGARAQTEATSFPATSTHTMATNQTADDTTTSDKGASDITTSEQNVTSAQGNDPSQVSANDTSVQSSDSDLPSTNVTETSSPSNTTTPSADSDLPSTDTTETSSPSNTTTPSADSELPSTNATETSSPSNTTTPSADSDLSTTNATETSSSTNSSAPVGTPDTPPPATAVVTTTGVVTSPPGETVTAGETTDVTSAGGQTTSTISFSTTPIASSWEQEQAADADFIIRDDNNNPCLLANLDLTIRIVYNTWGGQNQTYEATMPGPDDVTVTGSCGVNMSTMKLTWNNRTLDLILAFVLQDAGDSSSEDEVTGDINENANSTWSLRQISLEYDTSDKTIFPGAADPKFQTTSTGDLNLFSTPLGQSYLCHQPQLLDVEFQGARLVFNHVHLMAFGVNSTRFSADTEDCLGGGGSGPAHVQDEAYTVPLIVACCLAAVVVLIVLGYAISRCVSRHKRQMEYKQMP